MESVHYVISNGRAEIGTNVILQVDGRNFVLTMTIKLEMF